MRAVEYDRYGPPDGLRLVDVPRPTPGPDQVLVEVAATSVNLSDWESLVGRPLYARLGGVRRPRRTILGSDIAGRVVEVGDDVGADPEGVAVGDEVMADNLWLKGGFADFAVIPASEVAPKPAELSFAHAAAIPQSGAIATQGTAPVEAGMRVLINGGGGGSGPFAIQLAAEAGAHVTAVDTGAKLDFMRSCGADEVLDYRTTDFASTGETWDHILDLVATRSAVACRRALAPGGRYWCVGGSVPTLLRLVGGGAVLGRASGRRIGVLGVQEGPAHFGPLAARCAAGEVAVHLDGVYPLDGVPDALARVGQGATLGKVVIEP